MPLYLGKLGRLQPDKSKLLKLPKFADYVDLGKVVYPPNWPNVDIDFSAWTRQYPMWENDRLGICVPASLANCVLDWCAAAGIEPTLTLEQVRKFYFDLSPNDNGCWYIQALEKFRTDGLGDYKISAHCLVDQSNVTEMQLAHWWFGGLVIGIEMPLAWQNMGVWKIPPSGMNTSTGEPNSWGGHGVRVARMRVGWNTCTTWGQKQDMEVQVFAPNTYTDEVHALLSPTWASPGHQSPNGFAFEDLVSDLGKLGLLYPN